ncbi:MAG: dihydroneopterin aldolase, partial [Ilumatobacteraceae bacterium]
MTDQIEISAIRTVAIVGALPHEREIPQPLQIDLTLEVDLADAGRSDDLDDTVHYGWVADQVVAVVSESKDVLLERLAARVADEVLTFDRVEAVTVTLTKLRPPIAVDAASTAVRINRTRSTSAVAPQSPHRA